MPAIKIRVKSNKQLVPKSKEDLRAMVPKVAKSNLKKYATELKTRMKKPGRKVKYPITWENFKQKIKVIVKLRKAKNLPYKRSKKHQQGWQLVQMQTGYSVENKVRGSKWIYGDPSGTQQSTIHSGRWPFIKREADIVIRKMPQGMFRALSEATKRLANTEKAPVK